VRDEITYKVLGQFVSHQNPHQVEGPDYPNHSTLSPRSAPLAMASDDFLFSGFKRHVTRNKGGNMPKLLEILNWRSRQSPLFRWGGAIFLFLVALSAPSALGPFHGGNSTLTIYPTIFLASVLLGWKEALLFLGLLVAAGEYLCLSTSMYLIPVGWLFVGGLNIAVVAALTALAEELAAANRRQRVLFREAQHRVANTLQAVVGALEAGRRRMMSSPTEAAELMEEAAKRVAASADIHRRLSDLTLFQRSLRSILQDAVSTVIDRHKVNLIFDVKELDLTFEQMSITTMLVIEAANNAQKHVFRLGRGSNFSVSLKALPDRRALLMIWDDGPGLAQGLDTEPKDQRLGFQIIRDLASELDGTFSVTPGIGIIVEFPIRRQGIDRDRTTSTNAERNALSKSPS
jgi:two-component sensor histidine kinase